MADEARLTSELSPARLEARARGTSPLLLLAAALLLAGVAAIVVSAVFWAGLAGEASDYYAHDLAERDSAPGGSPILPSREALESGPRWLAVLAILGVAFLLAAAALVLRVALSGFRLRMVVMAVALSVLGERRPRTGVRGRLDISQTS